ncbi:MAG: alanine racemase [Phycisphaerales bacterium]|nr:alanine racemase [Phycisphaerales bacterium]
MMIEQQGRLEISQARVLHNVQAVRAKIGKEIKICATVKANAYGHGVREMVSILRAGGVDWLAVYSMDEMVRDVMDNMAVLVLAPMVTGEHREHRDVRVNVMDETSVRALSQMGCTTYVHMQVDTGLTRGGVAMEQAVALAELIAESPGLKLEGIFSHFSHGDEAGHATIDVQARRLTEIAARLKTRWPKLMVHMQNSGGVWNVDRELFPQLDMVRVGIALYGLQPNLAEPILDLLPVARLVAPILAIHDRPAGVGVGYGHAFITTRSSRLAIVPVGYADGYPRGMSNRGVVQVGGADAPVVGRVSMDQIIVDVTDLPATQVGDEVTVIAWDPAKPNCMDRIAATMETIGYEITTGLGSRLKRVVVL